VLISRNRFSGMLSFPSSIRPMRSRSAICCDRPRGTNVDSVRRLRRAKYPSAPWPHRDAIGSGGRGNRVRVALALMKTRAGERIWKAGKQEDQSFAASGPAFLLSRFICSTEQMALRCIAGRRPAGAVSCPAPRDLLAPCQNQLTETTEHNSAKSVRHF
jgi:hypothetical protein